MKLFKIFFFLLLILSFINLASCKKNTSMTKEVQPAPMIQEFTGYLMDVTCGTSPTGIALDKTNVITAPQDHSVMCLKVCENSGFGISIKNSDNNAYKFTKFDEKGSSLAKDLLYKTVKIKGIAVSVKGVLENEILKVDSIEESKM